jgi:hypothetical protein
MYVAATIWAWHPPVGTWVAILGALGVLVPLLRDVGQMGKKEKALWTAVMFALLFLEVRTLYRDRRDHDNEQQESRERSERNFQSIANGIQAAITQSQVQFEATLDRSEKIIRQNKNTLGQVNEAIKTVTGGDSFAGFLLVNTGLPTHFTVFLTSEGKYPLHDLYMRDFDCITYPSTAEHAMADRGRGDMKGVIGDLPAPIMYREFSVLDDTTGIDCHALFIASNGSWNQMTQVRLVGGVWKQAQKIVRHRTRGDPNGKVLSENVEKAYPREPDGSIKWFMTLGTPNKK